MVPINMAASEPATPAQPVEGQMPVAGGHLHYRLAGPASADTPVLVFENGWSGSFPYAIWLEQALASRLRVLCYDRASTGYSQDAKPPTAKQLSEQLARLLDHLGIAAPVVIAGHSYGGLIAALHATQMPPRVRALVQIDPTPDDPDPLIDPSLRIVPTVARLLQLCALLRLDGPLLAQLRGLLPADSMARLRPSAGWLRRSLNGAIAEIGLLHDIRRTIAAAPALAPPRLVISAAPVLPPAAGRLDRWLGKREQQRRFTAAAHARHKHQAALNPNSHWLGLPYGHVELIADRAAAQDLAARILHFLDQTGRA